MNIITPILWATCTAVMCEDYMMNRNTEGVHPGSIFAFLFPGYYFCVIQTSFTLILTVVSVTLQQLRARRSAEARGSYFMAQPIPTLELKGP